MLTLRRCVRRHSYRIALTAVIFLAVALRFSGLDWGIASLRGFTVDGREIPFPTTGFHPDSDFLERATASLRDSPYPSDERDGERFLFSSYGPVFMYLHWAAAGAGGWLWDFEPFSTASVWDANATRLAGRAVSAATSVLCVWLTCVLAARCFGPGCGLLAALLLAATPMAVQAAHMSTVDGISALCAAWISLHAVQVSRKGATRDYLWAGVVVGVATATKLTGAFLAVPLVLGHILATRRERPSGAPLRQLGFAAADRRIWWAAGAALAVYLLLTPAAVFRFQDYFLTSVPGNIFHAIRVNRAGPDFSQRGTAYLMGAPAYLYHFFHIFPSALGWPLEIAAFAGMAYAFRRRSPGDIVVAGSALAYFLVVGQFYDKPVRYFVVIGPWLAVLAARLICGVAESGGGRRRIFVVACAVVVSGYTMVSAAALVGVYHSQDSRVSAAQWVQDNVPAGDVILLERGHNNLAGLISPSRYAHRIFDVEQAALYASNDSLGRNGDYLACFQQEHLSGANHIVISDDRLPLGRMRESARLYYSTLLDGSLGFNIVASFRMQPRFLGIPFDDSRADLNSRRYDHPATFVLGRSRSVALFSHRPDLARYLLRSPEDCLRVFSEAIRLRDYILFQRCLPASLKASFPDRLLHGLFQKFLAEPELVQRVGQPGTLVQENGIWRVRVQIDVEPEA